MLATRTGRTLIAAAFIAAIAFLFALQVREAKVRSDRMVGVYLEATAGGVEVVEVEPGMPAERAGLRRGDEILAIDGKPLRELVDYDVAAADLERGRSARFRVRRDGEIGTVEVVPGVEFPLFQFALDTLALCGYLGLALFALFRGLRDLRARLLFLFAAAVSIELALPFDTIGNPVLMTVVRSVFYLLTGLEIGLELHLASVIPHRYGWLERRPWLVPGYYALGLLLGGITTATFVLEQGLGADVFPWTPLQTDILLLELGMPLWAVAVPLILTLQAVRAEEPRDRHRAGLVLAGVMPWTFVILLGSVVTLQGRPVPEAFLAVETLALLAYPLAVFIAIYRYQLFDLELVVRRGLLYATLTGGVVLVFYAALGAGSAIFSNLFEQGRSVWFISGVTLVLGLLFAPLRRALQELIDRRFFPERHALRERLIALSGELPGLGKLPLMGNRLVARIREIFAVRSAALLLTDPESRLLAPLATIPPRPEGRPPLLIPREDPRVLSIQRAGRPHAVRRRHEADPGAGTPWLAELDGSVAAPLLVRSELIGILVLGPKKSTERFPAEELELLGLLTHHVATVFQNARLFESATYESLTGLLRREAVVEILEKEIVRARRHGRPLTVGMADLDRFKEVNDRYGHLAGDTLLQKVAQVLCAGMRESDAVGRYGGEEFLLVLPETDLAGGRVVADKLRQRVEEVRMPMDDGRDARVTISIGLAGVESEGLPEEVSARDLLLLADKALYRAKEEGRNRVHPPKIARAG